MNLTTVIWVLLSVNVLIALLFSHAVGSRKEPWGWPPSWVRVVTMWLGSKAVWLTGLAVLWQLGWVGFLPACPAWGRDVYIMLVGGFTFFHAVAAGYYLTGRAAIASPPLAWDGDDRRSFIRRQADRERESPLHELIRERETES